ncbi:MAG: hypothetical protein WC389_15360 [Lutibacter sp.]|jgi:hypothetical protein
MSKPWGQLHHTFILDSNFRDLSDKDIRAWIFLRALATRSQREGYIEQYKDHGYKIETLADLISFTKEDLEISINQLINPQYDILEQLENNVLHFKHWDEEEIPQIEREKKYAEIKKRREHAKRKSELAKSIHDASTTVDYLDHNPEFAKYVREDDIKKALDYIIKNNGENNV